MDVLDLLDSAEKASRGTGVTDEYVKWIGLLEVHGRALIEIAKAAREYCEPPKASHVYTIHEEKQGKLNRLHEALTKLGGGEG